MTELCKSTKIKLLEAKIAVLESKLKEYIVNEQLVNETNALQNKFTQFVQGVQKEYPGYLLDNSFNLISSTKDNDEGNDEENDEQKPDSKSVQKIRDKSVA